MRAPTNAARRALLERLLALPPRVHALIALLLVLGLLLGGRLDVAAGLFPWPWSYVAHFLAYGTLAALLWLAGGGRRPLRVVLTVALVGLGDELHQATLDGRQSSALDWAVDILGAAVVVTSLETWQWLSRRRRRALHSLLKAE